jgi:hypothetical protein
MMDWQSGNSPLLLLQKINPVTLPGSIRDGDPKHTAAKILLSQVFLDFMKTKNLSLARLEVLDSFLFLFNNPDFSAWPELNWWEQRQQILKLKDHQPYRDRALRLLHRSRVAPYLDYSDEAVAGSNKREVKQAWMRKRLVLQECFWNTIDSVSHAAYHKNKYAEMFPALWLLLCNVSCQDDRQQELFFGIDNGAGYLYKKKSRDSLLYRVLYKAWKYMFRSGVFYIGGLKLGLLETDGELSCHGAGAVVYQGWQD